jgi:hypothetical protein
VPFTNANATLSIVVVAVTNDVISAPSATLTLLNQFAAPTLNGSITYSGNTGNTATMTYNVADGVTEVQVRNATSQAVISSTTSVNTINRTASVSVNLTQNVSIVVVARTNSYGRESPASFVQDLTYINFSALVSINGGTIKYTGSSERVPMYTPLFISANLRGTTEWFAVVRQDMKNDIANYGYYNTSSVFTPPSSSVPVIFNNIITTFMTNMDNLFRFLTSFNQPIGSWNTSAVLNMRHMFSYAIVFNQPIGSWNTAAVDDMTGMFYYATAFVQNVSAWVINSNNQVNTEGFGRYSGIGWDYAPPVFRNSQSFG